MGVADIILFAILTLADMAVLRWLHIRRSRRLRTEGMMRSLRSAVARETGTQTMAVDAPGQLVLQRAS